MENKPKIRLAPGKVEVPPHKAHWIRVECENPHEAQALDRAINEDEKPLVATVSIPESLPSHVIMTKHPSIRQNPSKEIQKIVDRVCPGAQIYYEKTEQRVDRDSLTSEQHAARALSRVEGKTVEEVRRMRFDSIAIRDQVVGLVGTILEQQVD
jgi:hypothetical protein